MFNRSDPEFPVDLGHFAAAGSPPIDVSLLEGNAAVSPTFTDNIAIQQLEKAAVNVAYTFVPTGLDVASQQLLERVWQFLLSGRSSRVRRSWHVNFILLRRLSWLNPIIRPAINLIRQELRQLRWEISALSKEAKGRVILAHRVLLNPNPLTSWGEWLDMMVEDSLALDAAVSEIWTARYIPFAIQLPKLVLSTLPEVKKPAPQGPSLIPPMAENLELEEILGRQRASLEKSLLHAQRMAEAVAKERISWLEDCGIVKSVSAIRQYIEEMVSRLEKAKSILEAHQIMLEESPIILRKTFGGSEEELRKAEFVEPPLIPYPMDLPLALIPIPGEQVEFQGDVYTMVLDPYFPYLRVINNVIMRAYQRDEIMYVKENPRTWSFYGLSPIECVIIVAHVMLYAHDVQFRYFLTGAVPAAIVGVVGGGDVSELRAYLNEVARGKQEAIAVVGVPTGGNILVQRLAETNRELQYIQLLEWYSRLICIAFGLQPWELGILTGGTPSRRLLRQRPGVYGRFITWENAINYNLLQRGFKLRPSVDAIFRFVNKDIGDFNEEAQSVVNLVERGIITRNEARERLSYPPLTGSLPDHAYTVVGQTILLHGRSPAIETSEEEIPVIPSPVGFYVPPPIGGVGAPPAAGRGGGGGGLAGLFGLAKSIVKSSPNVSYSLTGYDEEVKTAIKIFARGVVSGGECDSYEEAIAVAILIKEQMERSLGRAITKGEWIGTLRRILDEFWELKWKREWDELLQKAEEGDLTKLIGDIPIG